MKLRSELLLSSMEPRRAPARDERPDAAPALRPVPREAAKPGLRSRPLSGALTAVIVLLTILMVQLGLSIAVSQGAYELRSLSVEQRDLERVDRLLTQNLDKLSSPQNLAENAVKLGMVQNANPATIRLSDGKVQGSLKSSTSSADANLVPNATLDSMPVVDTEGLLVDRRTSVSSTTQPIRWEGKLPAPETR